MKELQRDITDLQWEIDESVDERRCWRRIRTTAIAQKEVLDAGTANPCRACDRMTRAHDSSGTLVASTIHNFYVTFDEIRKKKKKKMTIENNLFRILCRFSVVVLKYILMNVPTKQRVFIDSLNYV